MLPYDTQEHDNNSLATWSSPEKSGQAILPLKTNYYSMKNILLLILLLTSSCQKEPDIRFGFDADFGKDSHGSTMMNVEKNTQALSLKGNVAVTEGEIHVELINPDGDIVFVQDLKSPESLDVNESFQAIEGDWKLAYTSIEGVGSVTLHLSSYE